MKMSMKVMTETEWDQSGASFSSDKDTAWTNASGNLGFDHRLRVYKGGI